MKNNKKILSVIAALALSSTMVIGATALTGCGDKTTDVVPNTNNTTVVKTAIGESTYSSEGGTTYYASPTAVGSVPHTGESSDPFNLFVILAAPSTAAAHLEPGDTLLVLPGDDGKYSSNNGITITVSGEFNKYIRIMNATLVDGDTHNDTPIVLEFYGQSFASANRGVQLYGNYIYWYGIDIAGAGDNGMYIGGSYNTVEYCEFYDNRDTGLQLGRAYSEFTTIDRWPSYNLVLNCTSHNNYDNESYGENADGFAAKLTVGYGNVFDGCIAYRNSDDGWDLYAKVDSGNIGTVVLYNCITFENGFIEYPMAEFNAKFPTYNTALNEANTNSYVTRDGDGNGFKLGGSTMEGDAILVNCLAFNNRMHGITDNSNPGVIALDGVTSYDNSAVIDNAPQINVGTEAAPDMQKNDNFGQIVNVSKGDTHGNIDVSRQTYSYNTLKGVLSVKSGVAKSLSADAYRGSAESSILLGSGTTQYRITESIDADSKNGITGQSVTALVASDVFTTLPIVVEANGSLTYNLSGRDDLDKVFAERVHGKYRNEDGSVNLQDILDIKATDLLGTGAAIGSDFNKENYAAYPHFYSVVKDSSASADASIVAKIKEALVVPTNADAVYQDFMLPATMSSIYTANNEISQTINPVTLSWESNNTSVIGIDMRVVDEESYSGSKYFTAIVNRATDDTVVTLTATITYGSATDTKTFTLNVKKAVPSIGEIRLENEDGSLVYNDGIVIVDRFEKYSLPTLVVENGMDYNGKLLDSQDYDVETTYMYSADSNSHQVEIMGFTPSNAGVYEITYKVKLKTDREFTNTMKFTVYVASTAADVDFVGESELLVNKDGFIISGDVSSATGNLYVVTSATEDTSITAANIISNPNVIRTEFRATSIALQHSNSNTDGYYVYYALGNIDGQVTSELYTKQIAVVDIATAENLNKVATGTAIGGESTSSTIYRLTQDINLTDFNWTTSGTFTGLLNGMGYTISNATITDTSLFKKVNGGTIMNVKFDEISITSSSEKAAIISEMTGGYLYNIAMTNIDVDGGNNQRVAALVGQILQGLVDTYIEQVSLVNDASHDITGGRRTGGLIGLIQSSQNPKIPLVVNISNCYVDTYVKTNDQQVGVYIGSIDGASRVTTNLLYLNIDHCIAAGTAESTGGSSRVSGFIGYQNNGVTRISISNSLSLTTLRFGNEVLTSSIKNASPFFGGFEPTANVVTTNLFATMDEYNSDYNVTALSYQLLLKSTYFDNINYLNLDETRWTAVPNTTNADAVIAPYVTLNFLPVA